MEGDSGIFGDRCFNVTYGNGKFVAGSGGIMYSNDGINWTKVDDRRVGRMAYWTKP